jgi:hypothetical protein
MDLFSNADDPLLSWSADEAWEEKRIAVYS